MDYKLSDLIELNKLQSLLESYYRITQMPSGILGIDGELLAGTGWRRVCSEFHKKVAGSRQVCKASNADLNNCEFKHNKYVVAECGNGLAYIVCPIIINGMHVANICQGQFLIENYGVENFREQARRYGYDEEEYMAAVSEIPSINLEKIEPAIQFLSQFAEMLGETGYKQLELLESQKNLKTSEECWKFAIEAMGDGVWDWNPQTDDVFFSDKCYEIIGDTRETVNFEAKDWTICIHPEDRHVIKEHIARHLSGGTSVFLCEFRLRCKDESYKWVCVRGKLVRVAEDGRPLRVVGVVIDINEKKRSEQQTAELDMLKNEFLANISHEMKTPINVIYSASQLLDLYINSDSVKDNIEKIKAHQKVVKQNCYRSQRLINNLIDISKIDSGYFELKLTNGNIVNAIEEIALSVKDYIENNGISVRFDTQISEKVIAFDPEKLERVVLNIISNAMKFTEPGGIISISIAEGDKKVIIAIKDTGAGIPKDKLELIFERFKQVDGLFIRRNEGSGIGLSLVKSIVELHGGRIKVESEFGKGSKFIIELPDLVVDDNTDKSRGMNVKGNEQGFIETFNIEFSDIYSKK